LQHNLGGYGNCRQKSHRVVDRGYGGQDLSFCNRRRYDEGEEEMVSFAVPFQSKGSMNREGVQVYVEIQIGALGGW
jgi:hypothetical protein